MGMRIASEIIHYPLFIIDGLLPPEPRLVLSCLVLSYKRRKPAECSTLWGEARPPRNPNACPAPALAEATYVNSYRGGPLLCTNPPGVSLNRLELKKQMRYFFRAKTFCVLQKKMFWEKSLA
jgi:hypothetical protein